MGKQVKDKVSFDNFDVILLLDNNRVFANNIIAVDRQNNEVWKINDIIKAEKPCGNSVIKKIDDTTLMVISTIGMMYEIDIKKKIVKRNVITR